MRGRKTLLAHTKYMTTVASWSLSLLLSCSSLFSSLCFTIPPSTAGLQGLYQPASFVPSPLASSWVAFVGSLGKSQLIHINTVLFWKSLFGFSNFCSLIDPAMLVLARELWSISTELGTWSGVTKQTYGVANKTNYCLSTEQFRMDIHQGNLFLSGL